MLPKQHRLPLRREFFRLQKAGKRHHSPVASLLFARQENVLSPSRFAIVVSKRLDKRAVRRNRTKRVLREAIKQLLPELTKGYDVAVYAKRILWEEKVKDIRPEIEKLLETGGILKEMSL